MKLVTMTGEPAVGKTFIFRKLREALPNVNIPFKFGLVRGITNKSKSIYILGVFDGSQHEGCDKLSHGAPPHALRFFSRMKSKPCTIYMEGDRLNNASLLRKVDHTGLIVRATEGKINSRHKQRKDNQPERFLKSKRTEINNIDDEFNFKNMQNNSTADTQAILRWLLSHLPKGAKMDESIDWSESVKYFKDLGKSTKEKRRAQFNKQADMDDDDPDAYEPAPGDARAKKGKESKHTIAYKKKYGEGFKSLSDILTEKDAIESGLKKKSKDSGIDYGILKQVFDRGMAAWKSGHRPGMGQVQWAYARVNSFIMKGDGTWHGRDKDLAAKVK